MDTLHFGYLVIRLAGPPSLLLAYEYETSGSDLRHRLIVSIFTFASGRNLSLKRNRPVFDFIH